MQKSDMSILGVIISAILILLVTDVVAEDESLFVPLNDGKGESTAKGYQLISLGIHVPLSPGWDRYGPLSEGEAIWMVQGNEFSVMFELSGASPNHEYTVGAHLFNPADWEDYPNVDNFLGWFVDRGTIRREGTTVAVEAWDFGYLTTDRHGNGKSEIFSETIPDGTYYVQFTVREGSECDPSEGLTDDCGVIYRTGEGFADDLERIRA